MATQLQLRRGTAGQTATFTGAEGEVTVNTTNDSLVVHDGITAGGFEVARTDLVNVDNATFAAKAAAANVGGGGGGGASTTATISGITQSNPGVVTTTAAHNFGSGQLVTFTGVGGMTQLDGNSYYASVLTSDTFSLYSEQTLTTPVNTTAFGAYTSGGSVTATNPPAAPTTASYVVISTNPVLTSERVLTAGSGIVLQDGGPGGGATITANLASTVPSNLGMAAAGIANTMSRSDHVHAMPTAIDVGAVPNSRFVIAGSGLSGGGQLTSNVTLSLSANLDALGDVSWSGNLTNGDALIYNSATQQWENTQNLPRMTLQSAGANVGTPNAVRNLNFAGPAVTAGQVVVSADTDPTKVNVSIPEIFTQERVEDIAGNMVTGSTQNGIAVTYDDNNGKINYQTNNFTISLTGDIQGSATVTNLGNVSITTQVSAGAVALGVDTTGNYVSSLAQTSGNTITLTNTTGNTSPAAYTIGLNTAAPDYIESVQDIAAGLLDQNTGTRGITAVYNDETGKTSLTANPFTIQLVGDVLGNVTVANLASATLTTQIAGNSVALGTDTTGDYVQSVTASGSGISYTGTGEGANVAIVLTSASINTANSVVYRDSTGSFAANVVTATLTGAASLNVLKAGDTMTGPLVLPSNPTANLQAATKQYVDQQVSGASFSLNTAAGTGTGSLTNGDTLTITGGTGITTALTGDTFTITNNGVTSLTAGTGVTLSAGTGAITISATGTTSGVSSVNSQTGAVTIQGTSNQVEVTTPTTGIVRLGLPSTIAVTSVTANSVSTTSISTTTMAATGAVTVGSIVNNNANGVGNIGSSSTYFDTVFARATSAQYADLAEYYVSDSEYQPGTVVKFGGAHEITESDQDHDPAVAGVVSTNPAYIMNAGLEKEYTVAIALAGRVPCLVQGKIRKGQMLVSAGNGRARAEPNPAMGTVIGKSLEDFDGNFGTVEIVVGRL